MSQRDPAAVRGFALQGGTHVQLLRTSCNRTMLENEMPRFPRGYSKDAKSQRAGQYNRHRSLLL